MKNKSKELIDFVQQWIDIAEEDLTLTKHGLSISSGISYRIICYHSQQSAEKYLKAYLVFHKIEFPYTHNITTLLDLCSNIDKFAEQLRDSEILSVYATANRYPGEYRNLRRKMLKIP
jgi:HEPN domain-containing protein